jgi:hypothetical protein
MIGSTDLAQTLIEHDLLDEYQLGSTRSYSEVASACSGTATPRAD